MSSIKNAGLLTTVNRDSPATAHEHTLLTLDVLHV